MNTQSEPRRVSRTRALLGAMAGLTIGLGAFAGSASAAISTPTSGQDVANGGFLNVTGTVPAGATHYAIATCDLTAAVGTECNHTNALRYTAITTGTSFNRWIRVDQTFSNWNFTTNSAGAGSTTCLNAAHSNGGSQCGVMVVYYTLVGGIPTLAGVPESVAIDIG